MSSKSKRRPWWAMYEAATGLTETQRAIYQIIAENGPGLTDLVIARRLGLTEWQVHHDCLVLNSRGWCTPGWAADLTEDQARVLYALPPAKSGGSKTGTALAEQLGMTAQEINAHIRALIDLGRVVYRPDCDYEQR
jgi:hypothetical protein